MNNRKIVWVIMNFNDLIEFGYKIFFLKDINIGLKS